MKSIDRKFIGFGLAMAALGFPLAAYAQAPPPSIGGGPQMAPPPPPPPPRGAGDVQNPVAIPMMPVMPPPAIGLPTPNLPNLNDQTPLPPMTGNKKSVVLRLQFTPGQTLKYLITIDADGSTQMGDNGTKVPMKQHSSMTLTQTVQSVAPNGDATMSESVGNLALTVNGQSVAVPAKNEQQLEKPFTVVMNTQGIVQQIGMPKSAAASSAIPGFDPAQLARLLALPTDAVVEGDTWHSSYVETELGLDVQVKYTLAALSAATNTATIGQKIYVQFKPSSTAASAVTKALPAGTTMSLTGTGTEQFDTTLGQIASQIANLNLNLKMTPTAGAQPMNINMQFTVDMERQTNVAPAVPGASENNAAPGN